MRSTEASSVGAKTTTAELLVPCPFLIWGVAEVVRLQKTQNSYEFGYPPKLRPDEALVKIIAPLTRGQWGRVMPE